MDDLIKALQIFKKYSSHKEDITCEHDCLYVCIPHNTVSTFDKLVLEALGFDADEDSGNFISYRFGSC